MLKKKERERKFYDSPNQKEGITSRNASWYKLHTLFFSCITSFLVKASALAITGTMFTFPCSCRMNSMSRGFSPWPYGEMK